MNKRAFQVKKVNGGYRLELREFRQVKRKHRPTVTKWVTAKRKSFRVGYGEKGKEIRRRAVEAGRDWCRGEKLSPEPPVLGGLSG